MNSFLVRASPSTIVGGRVENRCGDFSTAAPSAPPLEEEPCATIGKTRHIGIHEHKHLGALSLVLAS